MRHMHNAIMHYTVVSCKRFYNTRVLLYLREVSLMFSPVYFKKTLYIVTASSCWSCMQVDTALYQYIPLQITKILGLYIEFLNTFRFKNELVGYMVHL